MKFARLPTLLAAALFSAVVVIPFLPDDKHRPPEYFFEVDLTSTSSGAVKIYFNDGSGLDEQASITDPVTASTTPARHRLPLPSGTFPAYRFDPLERPATITIRNARIVDLEGRPVREFAPADFKPAHQIARATITGDSLEIETAPAANDAQLLLNFEPPLRLPAAASSHPVVSWLVRAVPVFLGVVGLTWFLAATATGADFRRALLAFPEQRPGCALALTALIAGLASAYPVVFLGKSFVSPNFSDGTFLLYDTFPTLPGYTDARTEDGKGSDLGATPWYHVPVSVLQHRALFRDRELPLWNRYDSSGVVLLGQGQSMFGDPLHFLPIIANGAAWSWDLKYLIARWLFAFGLGLTVWTATRHRGAALLAAFSAPFIGFFLYRLNHHAIVSLCYAPWILYAWLRLVAANDWRSSVRCVLGLVLANWCEINSGTAKEAYMQILGLNATGALILGLGTAPVRQRLGKFAAATAGGVAFAAVSAPVWFTFFAALKKGYTNYDNPTAFQIQPSFLLGLFDEIFYRPIMRSELVFNPSANFLVLGGVLYALATLGRLVPDRTRLGIVVASAVSAALAFGLVPPRWIVLVPILGNVAHIDNSISCVVIVQLFVLAGFGWRAACERLGTGEARGDLAIAALLLAALVATYIGTLNAVHRQIFGPGTAVSLLQWGQTIPVSPFVWGSLAALLIALIVLTGLASHAARTRRIGPAAAILLALCVATLLWRHGQHPRTQFDDYVFNPPVRAPFHQPSPAVDFILEDSIDPGRVAGFGSNLHLGWNAVFGLECIGGPNAVTNHHYRELLVGAGVPRVDWFIQTQPGILPAHRRIYDFLNVTHYAAQHRDAAEISRMLRPRFEGDLDIYVSDTAWPRAFFTDRILPYSSPADLAAYIQSGDGKPFAAVQTPVPSGSPPLPADLSTRTILPARDYSLTTNKTSFTVTTTGPGVIVLHEAFLPDDFEAAINGKPVPYFRVNHAFKGIAVDRPGEFRVTFRYWPQHFTASLIISGLAAVLLAAAWLLTRRKHAVPT